NININQENIDELVKIFNEAFYKSKIKPYLQEHEAYQKQSLTSALQDTNTSSENLTSLTKILQTSLLNSRRNMANGFNEFILLRACQDKIIFNKIWKDMISKGGFKFV
ncbi:5918_t:CDS:1, partial [Racocetra persica]